MIFLQGIKGEKGICGYKGEDGNPGSKVKQIVNNMNQIFGYLVHFINQKKLKITYCTIFFKQMTSKLKSKKYGKY